MEQVVMINNEYITKYLKKLSKTKDLKIRELEEYARKNKVPIIQEEAATFLKVQTALVKPKRILEIGTAIGYSAILMSEFMHPDGKIDTIEISYDMATEAKKKYKKVWLRKKSRCNLWRCS
jgi:predicted O-methyltransferase YrrM